jgi:hypothetical protein
MGKRSREQLSGGERHEAGSDAAGRVQITVRLAAWLEERRAWYWSLLKAANAPPTISIRVPTVEYSAPRNFRGSASTIVLGLLGATQPA